MMLDGSKDDTEPDPKMTTGEAVVGKCDHSKDMDSVALGGNNKDAADRSLDRNIVETEDMECQDTLVDHIVEEDAFLKYNLK
ncbi:hypothetical protein GUJ93_ZPchr0008g12675 [Zizania palustris]|uniref:Uncharacterized protein n=1 Tax=Zizania palustris TaxID=103762 RepID=A0A8J5RFT8_ZIZPA|nr:hypothetical protein GUJ93_ZPchr0008g12675 [Zizania palustris]